MQLNIENVTMAYGAKIVLQNFSMALPTQGVVALMGHSGCGKTTLLRLLAGLERPNAGQISLPKDMRISMVFQEDRLLDVLDARGNLLAVLDKDSEALADIWLERMGLGNDGNLYPAQMSGGMRRRLSIARAMAYGGDILLLDEAFQGLDDATKEQVIFYIFSAKERKGLTIMVTHDKNDALRVADRLVLLDGPTLRIVEDRKL